MQSHRDGWLPGCAAVPGHKLIACGGITGGGLQVSVLCSDIKTMSFTSDLSNCTTGQISSLATDGCVLSDLSPLMSERANQITQTFPPHTKDLLMKGSDGCHPKSGEGKYEEWGVGLELQSCCVFLPNDSLPSPSTIICGDIPGTVRSWYHNQPSMPGTLVVCLPQISVLSAGHKYMEPLQELPFEVSKPILEEASYPTVRGKCALHGPVLANELPLLGEMGPPGSASDAFPWTISLSQFSVYTLLGQQRSLSLLEPMGCTSTLAVTSHKLQSCSEGRHSFVVCLHVDLQPVHVKCSNPQVQLLYELLLSWSSTWARLQRHGILRQTSSIPDPPAGAAPSSPVRSSAGTALPDTSTCSPSADFGSPTEGDSVPAADNSPFADTVTLEQKTSSIGGTSGKVSLWMQWMLPKVTVKLFAPDPTAKKTEICVISELEDLSASVDVQDVYTKIKCKVGSFNIDHYKCRPGHDWHSGHFEGLILQCKETAGVRPLPDPQRP
ncbi:hypothetical protein INR49_032498 [Caranx melampygus]|nr:hypothetical protein INR49_032498 [Caranx melampygus]